MQVKSGEREGENKIERERERERDSKFEILIKSKKRTEKVN